MNSILHFRQMAALTAGFLLIVWCCSTSLCPGAPQRRGVAAASSGEKLELVFSGDSRVRGFVALEARTIGDSAVAAVEYQVNRRTVSPALAELPFSYRWQSASLWDGVAYVRAIGRNREGAIVAESDETGLLVANGSTGLRLKSPAHGTVVSGIVDWVVEAELGTAVGKPIYYCLLDGATYKLHFTPDRDLRMKLDTGKLVNGPHELYCSLDLEREGSERKTGAGMAWGTIVVDNPAGTIVELRPEWNELRLSPGEEAMLPAHTVFAGGNEGPPPEPVQYSVADPSVASVSSAGQVRGLKVGHTSVRLASGDWRAETSVVVQWPGFPHFTKDGRVLSERGGESLWVRNVMALDANEVASAPELEQQIRDAAINALSGPVYRNPVWSEHRDFESWKQEFDFQKNALTSVSERLNLSLLLWGDDIARTRQELHNSLLNPWAREAIHYAVGWARNTRRTIGIEMIDEVDFNWGSTPVPEQDRWADGELPLAKDSFTRLMQLLSVAGRPPIAWPVSGAAGKQVASNWMDRNFSDYNSVYWHYTVWRKAYPDRPSDGQIFFDVNRTLRERLSPLPVERPTLVLVQIVGPEYRKLGDGDQFVPGQDEMLSPGHSPAQVSAQILGAAALGTAGVKVYVYDGQRMAALRRDTAAGTGQHQTGAEPFRVGADRWAAMSAAFNVIQQVEPQLLQAPAHALSLGPGVLTGARQGSAGRLLMAVNTLEVPVTRQVRLNRYGFPGGRIRQFRVQGSRHSIVEMHHGTETASSNEITVTMEPCEAIFWVFEKSEGGLTGLPAAAAVQRSEATRQGRSKEVAPVLEGQGERH